MASCPTCNGTGRGLLGGPCSGCGGKGQLDSAHAWAWVIVVGLVAAFLLYALVFAH